MFAKGAANKPSRLRKRAAFDHETVFGILRDGMLAHMAFARSAAHDDYPVCLPMLYGVDQVNQVLYLHGSVSGGLFKSLRDGKTAKVCVTVTHLDGLVIARSLFHHSCNYRSVCVFGEAVLVDSDEERLKGMRLISDQSVHPSRWEDARAPNASELKSTAVIRVNIDSASAKQREGGPGDDKADIEQNVHWAGVVPIKQIRQKPIATTDDLPTPPYLHNERNY